MMFTGWVDSRWGRNGYRGARFANQADNTTGGGTYSTVQICADSSKDRYVYNVRSSRPLNEAGHPTPGAAQAVTAHHPAAAPQAAPAGGTAHGGDAARAAHGAPAAAAAEANHAPVAKAAPEIPAALAPIIAANPNSVAAAVEDDHAPGAD